MLSLMGSKTTMQPQGPYAAAPQRPANTETYPIILPLSLVRRLVGKLNHPRSWDNFLVYFSHKLTQMSYQPEGLGIHIYRLVASQAYA